MKIQEHYEDFACPESNQNYGVFSCQDLHEIGNITIQDIINHLGQIIQI